MDADMISERQPIFDLVERTDPSPCRHGEPSFTFLNRVSGAYWGHPRHLMQDWADHIGDDVEYSDLRNRLRSGQDDQFRSGFLELYLHECLIRAGYHVTVHPDLPGTTRHPDFYAERDGSGFYVEAISPSSSPAAKAAANRRAVLLDIVNQTESPNFFLHLVDLREGPNPPRASRLRNQLERWLEGLNPDDIDLERSRKWRWEDNGWAATFRAIPKSPGARANGSPGRAIGIYPAEVSRVDDVGTIHAALAEKHHAYRGLDAGFVIAVGVYIFDSDRWHSTNALYGHEAMLLTETPENDIIIDRYIREPDGYFGAGPDWRNHNVSAVLLVNQLMPWQINEAEATLWRHPAPRHPLPADHGLPWGTIEFDRMELTEKAAPITSASLLNLSEPWPPGEPW
ncbi:hypothetical protein [Nocardia gipuzkoensis]